MSRTRPLWILCTALVLLLICGRAPAQSPTGQISGTVQDSSGAIIPDANVTLTNQDTGSVRTIASSPSGEFVFTALSPGTYTVKVEKSGFRTYEKKSIILSVSQRSALGNIQLAMGQVSQTVEVTAQGEAVNTESADAIGSLSTLQVTDLGVKGRDV